MERQRWGVIFMSLPTGPSINERQGQRRPIGDDQHGPQHQDEPGQGGAVEAQDGLFEAIAGDEEVQADGGVK